MGDRDHAPPELGISTWVIPLAVNTAVITLGSISYNWKAMEPQSFGPGYSSLIRNGFCSTYIYGYRTGGGLGFTYWVHRCPTQGLIWKSCRRTKMKLPLKDNKGVRKKVFGDICPRGGVGLINYQPPPTPKLKKGQKRFTESVLMSGKKSASVLNQIRLDQYGRSRNSLLRMCWSA